MDDLKERIYLLALDMIKSRKICFMCNALKESYKEYIGTEELVSGEELKKLFYFSGSHEGVFVHAQFKSEFL